MHRCYLMLDFDGVIHPKAGMPETYFADLPRLEAVLRNHPQVDVVIVSSWRHAKPLAWLRERFSLDIRMRVVGVTPDIPPAPGASDQGTRQREVEAWLSEHEAGDVFWIALEDVASLYDKGAPILLTPDGFGQTEASLLDAALFDPAAYTKQCRERA